LQYNLMLEKADLPRRKRGEKHQDGNTTESPAECMVRQLAQARLLQLRSALAAQHQEILRLERQTELLSSEEAITEEEMDRILAEVIFSRLIN
jgi:hypothetical protein